MGVLDWLQASSHPDTDNQPVYDPAGAVYCLAPLTAMKRAHDVRTHELCGVAL